MKSMTGYGYGEAQQDEYSLSIEIKSYNNRYLDVNLNLPPYLSPLEPKARELIARRVSRGRIDVYVRFKEFEETVTARLDKGTLRAYLSVIGEIKSEAGIEEDLTLSHVFNLEGCIKLEKSHNVDKYWSWFQPVLEGALEQFEVSRQKEGAETFQDISSNLGSIEEQLRLFTEYSEKLEERIKENLRERFTELMGEQVDESRIMSETAVMLVKLTVHEEITRLKGHIDSFRSTLRQGGTVGKKLDFIAQEIHREVNTIGSKSNFLEVDQAVITVKDNLEKIREQLRNVE